MPQINKIKRNAYATPLKSPNTGLSPSKPNFVITNDDERFSGIQAAYMERKESQRFFSNAGLGRNRKKVHYNSIARYRSMTKMDAY